MTRKPYIVCLAKRLLLAAVVLWLIGGPVAVALEVPPYQSPLTDLGQVLSDQQRNQLEQKILAYRQQSSNEIGVLIVSSLEGESLEDYARDVFMKWGIGGQNEDNGVLFLVALADRKARLEVGYGLEESLTDLECGRIVARNSPMADYFRSGDYFGGISAVIDGIIAGIGGEYQAPVDEDGGSDSPIPMIVAIGIFALIFVVRIIGGLPFGPGGTTLFRGGWFSGGSFGGGGGGGGFSFGGGCSGGGGASGGW